MMENSVQIQFVACGIAVYTDAPAAYSRGLLLLGAFAAILGTTASDGIAGGRRSLLAT